MTVTIVFGDSADGYISSFSSSYATARAGTGSFTVDTTSDAWLGQELSNGTYYVHQAFLRWNYVAAVNEVVTSAAFRVYHSSQFGTSVPRDMEIRGLGWAAPLTSASFLDGAAIGGRAVMGVVQNAQSITGKFSLSGAPFLTTLLKSGSQMVSGVLVSSRETAGTTPTTSEASIIKTADDAGTTNDPALVVTSAPKSTLFGAVSAQVQLSDGSWALLESDGTGSLFTLKRYVTATTSTVIATVDTGPGAFAFSDPMGAQGLALVADASDNLYVLAADGTNPFNLTGKAFTKNAGVWTWAEKQARTVSPPGYSNQINQVVAAWHPTGGSGVIFAVVGHTPGTGISGAAGSEVAYVVLDCATLITGSGSLSLSSGNAPGSVLPQVTASFYYNSFTNETGTVLDVVASGTAGYVISPGKDILLGGASAAGAGRYEVAASGSVTGLATTAPSWTRKDATAKIRVVPTGTNTVATVTGDKDTGWGLVVNQFQATASGWTQLGSTNIRMDNQFLASMPSADLLSTSLAWDVVYVAFQNKLWIYYPDKTDPRIIRRTGVDLSTYQATKEEIVVSTVGAAGGTNLAIRVARQGVVSIKALITAAHRSSGGTLSTVYVVDTFNAAPTEPSLTARAGFDATQAATFAWTFSDPNLPSDGQTAYQLQIVRVSDGVTVVDTGKVASTTPSRSVAGGTLVNDVSYQWRVMTWDQSDLASPWSVYGMFSTGSSGSVTIIDPVADNPPGVITDDYVVKWTITGTTQTKMRAWVTRNDTSAIVYDSGWVTSATQSRTVTGMVSDVTHTVNVQVENSVGVRSPIASRLITPSYGTPDAPTMDLLAVPEEGYVLVSVQNPAPSGDRPTVTLNRVHRRLAGSGDDYEVVGEVVPGGSFRDYAVPSGVDYEYKVEAVAP